MAERESRLSGRVSMRLQWVLLLGLLIGVCSIGRAQEKSVGPTAKAWPLARGDQQATGVAQSRLPEKPQQLWKMTFEKAS